MTLRLPICRALLALSFLAAACGPDPDEGPTRFTLRFAPPEGAELEQHLAVTRTHDVSGNPTTTELSESVIRFHFQKTDAGYEISASQISASTSREGEPTYDPISQLLGARPAVYVVDPEGQFVNVRGYEDITERVATELPAEISELLQEVMTEEVLVQQGRSEWTSRYGMFAGKSVEVGEIWASQSLFEPIGGAPLPRYSVTRFEETQPCGDKYCLRIRVLYDSDLDELQESIDFQFEDAPKNLLADIEIAEASAVAERLRISGEIDRVVDPDTLLPIQETQLKMSRQTTGENVLTVTETRQYEFAYSGGTG